jgi:hypothetical protein
MKRPVLNFIIDAVAFLLFAFLTTTGVLMHYILPPGSGHRQSIWTLSRHEWGEIHLWIAFGFLATLALHLLLHWRWIVCTLQGRRTTASGLRLGLGTLGLIAAVGLAAAPLYSDVETSTDGGGHGKRAQHQRLQSQP